MKFKLFTAIIAKGFVLFSMQTKTSNSVCEIELFFTTLPWDCMLMYFELGIIL